MRTLRAFIRLIIGAMVAAVIFLAVVGALLLFTTSHTPTVSRTCPNLVKYADGNTRCVIDVYPNEPPIIITTGSDLQ